MEVRSSDEVKVNIENFADRLINMLIDKKDIDSQIKDLKQEFKEEGVPVGIVVSVINKIKAEKKKTDSEKFEEETIKEWIIRNHDIDNKIGVLIS